MKIIIKHKESYFKYDDSENKQQTGSNTQSATIKWVDQKENIKDVISHVFKCINKTTD